MRRKARLDSNHPEIRKALEQIGCSVQSLASVGFGCPDLLVGWCGTNYLMEVKDGGKSPSRQRLTDDEKDFMARWRGNVTTVRNVEEAVTVINKQR